MKKKIPSFKSDAAAERFVSRADLTRYDLSGLKPVQFEFEKKTAQLNMRLPKPLLDAVKTRARERGIPYTRFFLGTHCKGHRIATAMTLPSQAMLISRECAARCASPAGRFLQPRPSAALAIFP